MCRRWSAHNATTGEVFFNGSKMSRMGPTLSVIMETVNGLKEPSETWATTSDSWAKHDYNSEPNKGMWTECLLKLHKLSDPS